MGFKIIDRYLFGKMVWNFVYLFLVTYFVFGLIDVVANGWVGLHSFDDVGRFLSYYILYYNRFIGSFFSFFIFLAGVFTLYTIDNNHELIAIKTMGVSPARVIAPLIAGAIIISLLLTAFRELYVASQVDYLPLSRGAFINRSDKMDVNRVNDDEENFSLDGEALYLSSGKLVKPVVMAGVPFNHYGSRFTAKTATYCPGDNSRVGGWLFDDATAPLEFLNNSSLKDPVSGRVVFYSPNDNKQLESNQFFLATNLTPTNLVAGDYWFNFGKLGELTKAIKDPTYRKKRQELIISAHTRIMRVFTDLIPFFLGIPAYMNIPMGKKTIVKLFKAAAWAFPFVLVQFFCQAVGIATGIPEIAVFGPLTFAPFAVTFYCSLLRKEI